MTNRTKQPNELTPEFMADYLAIDSPTETELIQLAISIEAAKTEICSIVNVLSLEDHPLEDQSIFTATIIELVSDKYENPSLERDTEKTLYRRLVRYRVNFLKDVTDNA